MSEISLIVAGFGGQGVLLIGRLLAYGGMSEGREVTWIPSYGPEMRGGTANCTVIISDQPIGSPIVEHPDIALVLNQPSYDKYAPLVKPGGLLLVNSSLVVQTDPRSDITVAQVAASQLAEACGVKRSVNIAMLGALLGVRPIIAPESAERAIGQQFGKLDESVLEANLDLFRRSLRQTAPAAV
jgi:2-oxoglutarate ferredoxin oxidoreductase subunit gamma